MNTNYLPPMDGKKQERFVYCLTFSNSKCYVGVSKDPNHRLTEHLQRSVKMPELPISQAIAEMGMPEMKVLAVADNEQDGFDFEEFFISSLNTQIPNGYNVTIGGKGARGLPEATRIATGKKLAELHKTDQAFHERMMAIYIENGPRISESNKKFYATEAGQECLKNRTGSEWLKNITIANQKPKSEETLEKMKESTTDLWNTEEYRTKVNAAREAKQAQLRQENPEWVRQKKERMAESMRAKWADPEFAEKMKGRKRPRKPTPEQMIERIKTFKANVRKNWTPEKIALYELAEKENWSQSKRDRALKKLILQGLKNESQQK